MAEEADCGVTTYFNQDRNLQGRSPTSEVLAIILSFMYLVRNLLGASIRALCDMQGTVKDLAVKG